LRVREVASFFGNFIENFVAIGNEVEVLKSLQKPKKIIFYTNDGSSNAFLCKPKDDLRKDSRVMEFNFMINVFLERTEETRKRKLCKSVSNQIP
jgi:phosphatidylinositol kinase/protein kinase (PI-3  family)